MEMIAESKLQQTCTPITYTVEDAETAITMLDSKEVDIVSRALCNLCKSIETDEKILDFLLSKGIFSKIIDLLMSQQNLVNIKYTFKLFGLIVTVPSCIEKLDKKLLYDFIPNLLRFYFWNQDDFVKEACSLILIKLVTYNSLLSVYVCFKKIMRKIIKVLRTSIDPDVLKNSLDLFVLLMNGEEFLEQVSHIKCKHLNIFLCILDCDIDAIADISMNILHTISAMKVDKISRKMAGGETLAKMVSILTNMRKRYVEKATEIISNCIRNRQAAVMFSYTTGFSMLLDYLKVCDNNSLLRLLPIISILSKIPSIRKKMYMASTEDILFQFLKYRHEVVVLSMCQIIANFSMHKDCCKKMLTPVVIKYLVEILKKFSMDPYKVTAMRALYYIVKYEPVSLKYLSYSQALDEVQKIFLDDDTNYPQRFYEMAAEITCAMVYSPLLNKLDVRQLCQKILDLLRDQFSNKKVLLKMISILMDNTEFRQQFADSFGPEYFLSTIQKDAYTDTYQLNLDIIHNLIKYEDMALHFLNLGLMSLMTSMIKRKSRKSDAYKDIVDNLYESCLTLKLFDKKYLDDCDAINGLFFFFQEYTIDPEAREFKPIYIVNIGRNGERSKNDDMSTSSTNSVDAVVIKALSNRSAGLRAVLAYSSGDFVCDHNLFVKDEYLERYISELQRELYSVHFTLTEKIKMVALYVDRQLSGIVSNESEEEKVVHFKRHIDEICMKLGHRFVPLGFLRMGYLCEKTFMFKVLCDNLAIPVSFHQEKDGLFWNSVEFSNRKYCEVYIVDFKDKIGQLISMNSDVGREYLGK